MAKKYGLSLPAQRFSAWCAIQAEVNYPLAGNTPQSRLFIGLVGEELLAGAVFLRIDIPAIDERPARTMLFAPTAVKVVEPMTEEQARELLKTRLQP